MVNCCHQIRKQQGFSDGVSAAEKEMKPHEKLIHHPFIYNIGTGDGF